MGKNPEMDVALCCWQKSCQRFISKYMAIDGEAEGRRSPRSKYFVFTLNNPTEAEKADIGLLVERGQCTYVIVGEEVGEGGTPHLQGYLELSERKSRRQVSLFNGLARCFIDIRRGTQEAAIAYSKKDGNFTEIGTAFDSGQGTRTDLEAIREAIRAGATDLELAERHFSRWIVYRRSFERFRSLLRQHIGLRRDLRVIVLWGPAGTGKTSYVHSRFPNVESVYDPTLQWFDGYKGGAIALLDDFRGEARCSFLLKVLDVYPVGVPIKGGYMSWQPTTIFITSNIAPPWSYLNDDFETGPLLRRITTTIHVTRNVSHEDVDNMLA